MDRNLSVAYNIRKRNKIKGSAPELDAPSVKDMVRSIMAKRMAFGGAVTPLEEPEFSLDAPEEEMEIPVEDAPVDRASRIKRAVLNARAK